jgi:hypothetical protein
MDLNRQAIPEIEDLLADLRVVCNQRIVRTLSEFDETSYRILDSPIDELILGDLKSGAWTIEELTNKYGIDHKQIEEFVHYIGKKQDILDSGYLPRRVGRDERKGHHTKIRYSLIPIPLQARIFDPTLGLSLHNWYSLLDENLLEYVFEYQDDELFTGYSRFISKSWDVPIEKVENYMNQDDVFFISTIFGPLPIIIKDEIYHDIRRTLHEQENLVRLGFTNCNFQKFVDKFQYFLSTGFSSVTNLQWYNLQLYDALTYFRHMEDKEKIEELEIIQEQLFNIFIREKTFADYAKEYGILQL